MGSICYVDTSALVKRYVEEPGSAAFDDFCAAADMDLVISPLVATEFTGTLQKRVRTGEVTPRYASQARRRFHDEVVSGGWRLIEFESATFIRASELMIGLGVPLATLDALHLACALLNQAGSMATADRQLAAASRKAKLTAVTFE